MRVLVVADIHANYPALTAVLREAHDALICLGDLIGYGPHPSACVEEIRRRGDVVLQGNHDRALADHRPPGCRPAFRWLAEATSEIAEHQLDTADVEYLRGLPRWAASTLDDRSYVAVHATPADPQYTYLGPDPVAWAQQAEAVDADLILVGHTHLQFRLRAGRSEVINPGSVGQPKDGDPRAAYAVIDQGRVELKRVAYDVNETVRALRQTNVDPSAVAILAGLLVSGTPPSHPLAPAAGV